MSICQNCFLPLQKTGKCPSCGFDSSETRRCAQALPPGIRIRNGRYTVGRVLACGGFGITYKAKDNFTGRIVGLKEYMPSEYSLRLPGAFTVIPKDNEKSQRIFRHGMKMFADNAKMLICLRNNPIVQNIFDYFEENNTEYTVLQLLDGSDLRIIAKKCGGRIDSKFADECFVTLAKWLADIHRLNQIHREISPDMIIVSSDKKKITLLGLENVRNYACSQNNMPILLKPGYASPEQYNTKGNQGPWSDVYALCAVYYNMVSGKAPTDSMFRYGGQYMPTLDEMGCNVYPGMSAIIDKGMSLDVKDRYKNFTQLLNDIASIKSLNQRQSFGHNLNSPQPALMRRVPYVVFISSGISSDMNSRDIFKIGRRGHGCNMVLRSTTVSQVHCYLTFDGKNFRLTDVSSNGTFFENGKRLVKGREYILPPGGKFYTVTRKNMFAVCCR